MSRPSGLRGGSLVCSKNGDALTVLLQLANLLEEAGGHEPTRSRAGEQVRSVPPADTTKPGGGAMVTRAVASDSG